MKIKEKIRLFFLVLIIVPVILMSGVIVFQELSLAEKNAADSSNALKSEQLASIARITTDQALYVNTIYAKVEADLKLMARTVEGLFNNQINASGVRTYHWNYTWPAGTVNGQAVPGLHNDTDYGEPISWECSTFWVPQGPALLNGTGYPTLTSSQELYLNVSSNVDMVFKSIAKASPDYYWLYLGFENGLNRLYPYVNLEAYLTERDTNNDSIGDAPYDIRSTTYYINAITSQHPVYSNPYVEEGTTDNLILTASMPVHFTNGTSFGIVALDMTFSTILEKVNDLTILDHGYAFLIASDGKVVVHPAVDAAQFNPLTGGPMISSLESTKSDFTTILAKMKAGNTDQGEYMKGGKKYYIAFSPVSITGYSLAVVVPETDIIGPALLIKDQILNNAFISIIILLVVLLVVVGAVFIGSRFASSTIVSPIEQLTKAMTYISGGNLDQGITTQGGIPSEIGKFQHAFDGFLTMLQFGNSDFLANNLDRAQKTYTKALQIFTESKNTRGIGICYSNLGKISRIRGNQDQALNYLEQAVKIASETDDKKGLANRYNSIGIYYMDNKNYDKAEEFFDKALDIDQQINNINGLATVKGNKGLLYTKMQKYDKAENIFNEAISLAKQNYADSALAYAQLNKGKFYLELKKPDQALVLFDSSLALSRSLKDVRLAASLFDALSTLYEERGDHVRSHDMKVKAKALGFQEQSNKQILFVLDISGSMQGARLYAAKEGLYALFNRQILAQDSAGLIVFSDAPRVVHQMQTREAGEKRFLSIVKNIGVEGMTCFYDALGMAVQELTKAPAGDQKWIVALTDGEDNRSQHYNIDPRAKFSIQNLIKISNVPINVIVIGVGALNPQIENDLENLCKTSPTGQFISIKDPSDAERTIREAFQQVEAIIAGTAREQLEEFKIEE